MHYSRENRARLGALVVAAGAAAGLAHAQPYTVEEFIEDQVAADFYWPFENSFAADLPTSNRTKPAAYELGGIGDRDCASVGTPPSTFVSADYFPILADHMTRVGASPALHFGETTGDLPEANGDPVERYMELTSDNFGGTDVLEAFGMQLQSDWTMHMIVSPDEDLSATPGWQTLVDIGDPDYTDPIQILLKTKRNGADASPNTQFELSTTAQGATRSTSLTISDSNADPVNGRRWYQVVAQYYTYNGNGYIRLVVYSIDSAGSVVSAINAALSNESRNAAATGSATIGDDHTLSTPFFGAMHHFAVWDELVDNSPLATTNLLALGDAFEHSASITETDPRASELSIDWDADLRFFVWDTPQNADAITPGDRNLLSWQDDIWDREGVYPFIRMKLESYSTAPPLGATLGPWAALDPADTDEEQIATQTANWIEYYKEGIETYARNVVMDKSLFDTNASALFWQNFGVSPQRPPVCAYTDDGEGYAGKLTRDWRDTPHAWRNSSSDSLDWDHNGTGYGRTAEVFNPFYREGTSLCAFRTKDVFIALKQELTARGLSAPDRLHFDTEGATRVEEVWAYSGGSYVEGWWEDSVADVRANDQAFWVPPSVSTGATPLLDDLNDAMALGADAPNLSSPIHYRSNSGFRSVLGRFARDQYDQAFGMGLLLPALQELSSDIRLSEYGQVYAGADSSEQGYLAGKPDGVIEHVQPRWFDYSSPVLYPVYSAQLYEYNASTPSKSAVFAEWGERLGVTSRMQTPTMTNYGTTRPVGMTEAEHHESIHHDARLIYVERAKYNINANYLAGGGHDGRPIIPWILYPGYETFTINSKYDWDGDGTVEYNGQDNFPQENHWQDTARIAVFAHRHGVREFILWGYWYQITNANAEADVVGGMENVIQAVEHAQQRSTDMTTADTSTPDLTDQLAGHEGVPDGAVGYDDYAYFLAMHTAGDLEADFSGPDGYPDGVVNSTDETDYYAQWLVEFGT